MGKASRRKKGRLEEARVKGSREKRQARQEGRVKLFLRRNKRGVRAGLIFAASVGVSIFIFSRLVETEALFAFLAFTAQTTGFVLNILGMNVEVNGSLISSGNSAIVVVNECTAIVPMIIFLCAILAYPSNIKHKLLGLPIGLLALFLLNLIRLVSLFYIGAFSQSFLETAHLLIWQPLMILAVVVIWLVWVGRIAHVQPAKTT